MRLGPYRLHWWHVAPGGCLLDNVTLNLGAGGATCATDTIGGVDFQRIKLVFGPDGTNTGDVSLTNPLPVRQTGATSTTANVGASAASVTGLASNASRLKARIVNDSDKLMYVKEGATASATSYTEAILPKGIYRSEGYTGVIDLIWEAGVTGNARVTETTP